MSKKYFIPIKVDEKDEPTFYKNFPKLRGHVATIDSWKNFVTACDYDDMVINIWLETEYNAKLINQVIVFDREKDKIMWLLRWA